MARAMSAEREKEYAELRAYLNCFSTHVFGIDPNDPVHPTNVGKRIVEQYGKSKALEGLRQAVNDIVEALSGRSLEDIQRVDALLRERGVLTFSEVRRRYASAYRKILKRGRIVSETEFYLVAGILADRSSQAAADERTLLERLQEDYEREA